MEKLSLSPHILFEATNRVWPGSIVVPSNVESNMPLQACVVLCPLYKPGDLDKAGLIDYPQQIVDSRVSGKIEAYLKVLEGLEETVVNSGGQLALQVIFANKGVLGEGKPEVLDYHQDLYTQLFTNWGKKNGTAVKFHSYTSLEVDLPTFVQLNQPIPESLVLNESSQELEILTGLQKLVKLNAAVNTNKAARKVVKELVKANGMVPAFWLLAGYLAFDQMIHKLVGDGGVYIAAERLEQLLWVYKLTDSLKKVTKILLKA